MADLRARRLQSERALIERLVHDNPTQLYDLEWADEQCCLTLRIGETAHRARLHFPRFFPSVPIEAFLAEPVAHPNVDPRNGFVCLWTRLSVSHTVIEAVRRLRLILAWRMFNLDEDHVMQPRQAEIAAQGGYEKQPVSDLTLPAEVLLEAAALAPRPRRTRLEDVPDDAP